MNKMLMAILALLLLITIGFAGCADDGDEEDDDDGPEEDSIYRQRMRDFVIGIGEHARKTDPDFILIPQNGHDLLSLEPGKAGTPATDYIDAIDGMGQEDLLFGYDDDNKATPKEDTQWLQSLLDLGETNGLEALVTDYCWTQTKMDDSYESNGQKGYISFAADRRDLDNVPDHPDQPYNQNTADVTLLSEASNFLYLLDPSAFDSKQDYLETLQGTDHDVLIIDAFYDDNEMLSKDDVTSLKTKNNGGKRLVISYMSIGEAEDYRSYWKDSWKVGSPSFIDKENPNWEGNYKVKYWEGEWQKVIYGEEDSYTDKLLDVGFDGVYMDIIEAFEYYED
jgi:cysteinyl-tRNA synthetase